MSLTGDLRQASRLNRRQWLDLFRAVGELALARLRIQSSNPGQFLALDQPAVPPQPLDHRQARIVERIAFAIPLMGARVPWRSTCLVQALAAQHWLRRSGVPSSIVIGASQDQSRKALEAHAWLEVGGRVVVGGDVAGYARFSRSRAD